MLPSTVHPELVEQNASVVLNRPQLCKIVKSGKSPRTALTAAPTESLPATSYVKTPFVRGCTNHTTWMEFCVLVKTDVFFRGCCLLKKRAGCTGTLPGSNGELWKRLEKKYVLLEKWKRNLKAMTPQRSPRMRVEKYHCRNPAGAESNKSIFPYWRRCSFRRSIKTIEQEGTVHSGEIT